MSFMHFVPLFVAFYSLDYFFFLFSCFFLVVHSLVFFICSYYLFLSSAVHKALDETLTGALYTNTWSCISFASNDDDDDDDENVEIVFANFYEKNDSSQSIVCFHPLKIELYAQQHAIEFNPSSLSLAAAAHKIKRIFQVWCCCCCWLLFLLACAYFKFGILFEHKRNHFFVVK